MQIPVIKHLSESYNLEQLKAAEEALMNEEKPIVIIEGKDEGEQLTHVLAAIQILEDVRDNSIDVRTALRNYTQRVRNSIS